MATHLHQTHAHQHCCCVFHDPALRWDTLAYLMALEVRARGHEAVRDLERLARDTYRTRTGDCWSSCFSITDTEGWSESRDTAGRSFTTSRGCSCGESWSEGRSTCWSSTNGREE